MSARPLLVGEDNPYGADPGYALYPNPPRSAGGRLCYLILGLGARDYLRAFDRANLCAGKWSMPAARAGALDLLRADHSRPLVLLGRRVAEAFGFPGQPPFTRYDSVGHAFFFLPHPSGRCRAWNEPGAVERARALLAALLERAGG